MSKFKKYYVPEKINDYKKPIRERMGDQCNLRSVNCSRTCGICLFMVLGDQFKKKLKVFEKWEKENV